MLAGDLKSQRNRKPQQNPQPTLNLMIKRSKTHQDYLYNQREK